MKVSDDKECLVSQCVSVYICTEGYSEWNFDTRSSGDDDDDDDDDENDDDDDDDDDDEDDCYEGENYRGND